MHITGPISSLPGAVHPVPAGTKCDEHPDRDAVSRVQGETDSFGAELNDCCAECEDRLAQIRGGLHSGQCDWCKKHRADLKPTRDYDEGSYGSVYNVCRECRRKQSNDAAEELAAMKAQEIIGDVEPFNEDDFSDIDLTVDIGDEEDY